MKKGIAQRMKEVRHLYEQLEALGLHEGIEEIAEFCNIANHFVRTGDATSGAISIPHARRMLIYELSASAKVPCNILMKSI